MQLGGDVVSWDKGLIGLAKIEKSPYDEGYDKDKPRNFKIQISMSIVLDKVIKREDFRYYIDAYDAGGIGPNTKGEQNQAIKGLLEQQAVAILRVILENEPLIENDLKRIVGQEITDKVLGKMTRLFEKTIDYYEYLNMIKSDNSVINQDEIFFKFKEYLERKEPDKKISESYPMVLKRSTVIKEVKDKIPEFKYESFYQIVNYNDIEYYYNYIIQNIDKFNLNDITHYSLTSALIKYTEFLKQEYLIDINDKNLIFYGVPGVGKSYRIKKVVGFEKEKTVFHPEYTNADFVGQLLPVKNKSCNNTESDIESNVNDDKHNSISYEFVPGPFTRILAKAINNPNGKYMLVIDEINRGNAAAIFGEIFQLLDRDESGKSEFNISNKEIYDYLIEKEGVDKSLLPDEKIYIPSNLYIWATMNTSDQNVYTLDTAFQRRWQMEMLTIDFDKDDKETKEQARTLIPNSKNELTWKEFVTAINDKISEKNEGMISVEDKRIGPWFAKKNEIEDIKLFTQKVIKYLWDDAFKMSRPDIFNNIKNLDEIVTKINKGTKIEDIFANGFFDKILNEREGNKKDEQNEIEESEQ